jgi:signal transduction histidine kinase
LQQQKDDLFAIIIHDIKNPAALIKSLVDLLRSYDLTATEQQEIIEDIFETTTRIVTLSQEVSRILALEGTSLHLNLEPGQMNEVVRAVHRRNLVAANNKSISLLLDLEEELPMTLLDSQKMDEVTENLVSNAIKFSHKGGQVRIKSYTDEKNICIEVSDNGLGLSQEDIKKAFQRGVRLSALPTANEPSSGFGLWIVKKLVEAHGGRVEVRSSVGVGSTFIIELPIIEFNQE